MREIREATGIRPLNTTLVGAAKSAPKKKEKSAEQLANAEAGRRRGILMQLKPLLDQVAGAEDKAAEAAQLIATKRAEVDSLKKKAQQKAQNELEILLEELAPYLV